MMKLGIGVITTPSRDFRKSSLRVTEGTEVFVHMDWKFRGVAYSRNECLKALYDAGCEYMALSDDDLIYHMPGWLEKCTEQMERNRMAYACLPHVFEGERVQVSGLQEEWGSYIGAFYILHRRVIEDVGYFSPAFTGYGFEDVHYKSRLERVYGKPSNPPLLPYLVSSMDVLGLNPPPSILDKAEQIKKNEAIFREEMESGLIYYPYPGK